MATDSRLDSRLDSNFDTSTRPRGLLWPWLRAGAATAVFRSPRWPATQPTAVALLAVLLVVLGIALQRAMISGPAVFHGSAINTGWLTAFLVLWLCWLVSRDAVLTPGTGTLFGVLLAQQIVISIPISLIMIAVVRFQVSMPGSPVWASIALMAVAALWMALAPGLLLWRLSHRGSVRAAIVVILLAAATIDHVIPPAFFWRPDLALEDAESALPDPPPALTQETMEAQSGALLTALNALQPQRPGVIDLYAITFAPYADEDVFSREATMVSEVMRTRFDARGHVIQLQNHLKTAGDMPWATGLNLQRAIQRAASLMNRDEDILFLHLTSHGARDGKLSADFGPISVAPVTPQQLKGWLDEAGIRWRVVSISACFSGSWIAPLSSPETLVMTAADADHTSYGCGKLSELTFFGRAMYDEQLRSTTHSFEAAHAAARTVIDQREKEAGKTDGYSNPQISVGAAVKEPLARLSAQLDALPPAKP